MKDVNVPSDANVLYIGVQVTVKSSANIHIYLFLTSEPDHTATVTLMSHNIDTAAAGLTAQSKLTFLFLS